MDLYISQWINNFSGRNICLDSVAIFFAEYFQFLIVFFLFLFLLKDFKKYLGMVVTAIAAAVFSRFVFTEIIRYLLPRTRPFVENGANLLISHNPSEPSFPSGHASFFFAMSTAVYFYNKKLGILFFILAFLISISRVFVGIHWPSDVLAGAIVGIFSAWLVLKLSKKFLNKKEYI